MCFNMLFLDTACRMFVFLLVVHCVLSSGIIKETMNEWSPLRVLLLEFCNGGSSQKCDDVSIRLDTARALDRQTDRRSVCIAWWRARKKSSTAITWLISENLISSPVLLRLQQQNVWHNFIVRITDFSRKFRLMHGSMFEVRYTVKHFKTNVPISCNQVSKTFTKMLVIAKIKEMNHDLCKGRPVSHTTQLERISFSRSWTMTLIRSKSI